ncbi:OmpH family outer membrane protein [Wenyingzhuangia sp. 2_MG-2023]|uniref:OmpH family outer membrane protein n=1 Tax=Wenyingzhuangia sp. 2_MG-2023 TaxID=3062639 RepID=UPI0026E44EC2|nr:OmpH family outer membrane protein [Wenyingzhuangia sp. 2_MG-2023]MDO6736436.1 OmpH family outer membrane protein [Wenyingzhuangia sp. 2_MG-2023]MDO6801252.1 OmpH family outer membrane protein [Wenyingzhuangia sp. 1_MG-2023]
MKQVKTTLLIAIIAIGFTHFAQAQKVAHINLDEVVASMPEAKTMQTDMEKLGKTYESEIKAASAALKAKFDRYTAEEKSKTPEENQQRAAEVQQEQVKIQQLQQAAQQELQKKQNELLEPIIKKAQDAIKAYAKEKGLQYILDARTLIYSEGGEDISAAIKTKLGVN